MRVLAYAVVASLAVAAPAVAATYPPPANPPGVQKAPKGPHHTLKVGKKGSKYTTIQAAVKAKAGDTIRVANGTYKGQVEIAGSAKRYIQVVGNVKHPEKVMVELEGKHGPRRTASTSTTPTRSGSPASRPSTTRPTASSRST